MFYINNPKYRVANNNDIQVMNNLYSQLLSKNKINFINKVRSMNNDIYSFHQYELNIMIKKLQSTLNKQERHIEQIKKNLFCKRYN